MQEKQTGRRKDREEESPITERTVRINRVSKVVKGGRHLSFSAVVVVGDGECHEGTIWESALVAQNFNLGNLCCIVDLNGSAEQILPHPSIEKQWKSFGWDTVVIDGHDPKQIEATLLSFRDSNNQKPLTVIANTIKGKGLSFMEGHGPWHYKVPNEDEYKVIIEKLNL